MKLSLGTAQFSSNYGISNKIGKPDQKTVFKILKFAKEIGIKSIDTAQNYFHCEKIIKKTGLTNNFNINTKIDSKNADIFKVIQKSLKALRIPSIDILYVHDVTIFRDKKNGKLFLKNLEKIKKKKLIKKIGISIYTMAEFKFLIKNYKFDALQIPINIFNQRFNNTFFIENVEKKKIFVEARSVFMQGLFFIDIKKLPNRLSVFKKKIIKLNKISNNNKIRKISICLNFLKNKTFIKKIIIGVNTVDQLRDIDNAYQSNNKLPNNISYKIFKSNSKFVDINKW
jgi:aryl-alcohol dehydrogenase-like predicted oxidoreductase